MTPEEKRAYQNGLICGLSVRSVMDTADGQRKAILADMAEINQTMPASSTWEAIHKAIRSWNISGPRVKIIEDYIVNALTTLEVVGVAVCSDSLPYSEALEIVAVTTSDTVAIVLT